VTRLDRSTLALGLALTGLAGYVDALGFMRLGGYFVAFMSGNSTQVGVDMVHKGPLLPLLLIAGFVAGVTSGSLVGHTAGKRRRPVLLACVGLLLLAAAGSHAAGFERAAIAAMAFAMGAENTIFEEDGDVRFGVTYVTGSLVKMGQRIATACLGGKRGDWVPFFLIWMALICGATLGSFSYARFGLTSLWIAAATALLLIPAAWPRK
jgi:uncharacterized membrane protein YoaK (UPF0700 family)